MFPLHVYGHIDRIHALGCMYFIHRTKLLQCLLQCIGHLLIASVKPQAKMMLKEHWRLTDKSTAHMQCSFVTLPQLNTLVAEFCRRDTNAT